MGCAKDANDAKQALREAKVGWGKAKPHPSASMPTGTGHSVVTTPKTSLDSGQEAADDTMQRSRRDIANAKGTGCAQGMYIDV
jgi:hypothetical protein